MKDEYSIPTSDGLTRALKDAEGTEVTDPVLIRIKMAHGAMPIEINKKYDENIYFSQVLGKDGKKYSSIWHSRMKFLDDAIEELIWRKME
jgi:hypothetical protein